MIGKLRKVLSCCLGNWTLDLRSLAVLRIGLGLLILADLAIRAIELQDHYTDAGYLPRDEWMAPLGRWSLYLFGGSSEYVAVMFGIAAVLAVMMVIGLHTRLVTVLSWVMLLSLQNRNYMILNGGDVLFLLFMWWAIFLPVGAVWSVDSYRKTARSVEISRAWLSFATVGFIIQLCLPYLEGAIHKHEVPWLTHRVAIYLALSLDEFSTPLGEWLSGHHRLLRLMTPCVYYLEAFGPLLLLIPWRWRYWRTVVILLFVGFHAGLAVSMMLGLFPYICIVGWLALLPGSHWDWLARCPLVQRLSVLNPLPYMAAALDRMRWPSLFSGVMLRRTFTAQLIAVVALGYMLAWSYNNVSDDFKIEGNARIPGHLLRWGQRWRMFASPLRTGGWHIIEARLEDDTRVDLFSGGQPLTFDKPRNIQLMYPSQRLRKYVMNIRREGNKRHRAFYVDFHVRRWNEANPDNQVVEAFFHFQGERTMYPGHEKRPVPQVLYHWRADSQLAGGVQ